MGNTLLSRPPLDSSAAAPAPAAAAPLALPSLILMTFGRQTSSPASVDERLPTSSPAACVCASE